MGDSVGHTAPSLSTGILGGVVEEDRRFRPKSVDLLGDCRIIDSRAPITLDAREDNNKRGFPLVLTTSVALNFPRIRGNPGFCLSRGSVVGRRRGSVVSRGAVGPRWAFFFPATKSYTRSHPEDDKPGEVGTGLHPGLPGTSFRPWEGGQSGKQMSIRFWNCHQTTFRDGCFGIG